MSELNDKFQSIYRHFQSHRKLPEGTQWPVEDPAAKADRLEFLIDTYAPTFDADTESANRDRHPAKGFVIVPEMNGAGLYGAQYSGDSKEGELLSTYDEDGTNLARNVIYNETAINSLRIWHIEDEDTIFAENFVFDRQNPKKSVLIRQTYKGDNADW